MPVEHPDWSSVKHEYTSPEEGEIVREWALNNKEVAYLALWIAGGCSMASFPWLSSSHRTKNTPDSVLARVKNLKADDLESLGAAVHHAMSDPGFTLFF